MNSNQPALRRLSLLSLLNLFTSPKSSVPHRRISSAGKTTRKAGKEPSPPTRDSAILEKFNLRWIKGAVKERPNAKIQPRFNCAEESGIGKDQKGGEEKMVVWGFEGLGLGKEEMREAMEEMGLFVPSEIQCVGIPAILEGKNLVLSSPSGSGRTLAYLFPLLQMLGESYMEHFEKGSCWESHCDVLGVGSRRGIRVDEVPRGPEEENARGHGFPSLCVFCTIFLTLVTIFNRCPCYPC